jgi:hypothetical protein
MSEEQVEDSKCLEKCVIIGETLDWSRFYDLI